MSIYVDILIARNSKELIDTTKRWLSSNFEMKYIGEPSYILGVKIVRDHAKRVLGLIQETYIKKNGRVLSHVSSKPMNTHVDKSLSYDLSPKTLEEKEKMSRVLYVNVVGSLMYTMMCTHPDKCYVIGLVSRYQSNPGQKHWMAVKSILRYLKGTSNYMLYYQGNKDLQLIGYSDAYWGGDLD